MDQRTAEGVIACLPRGKTPYYYFKDHYAQQLLGYALDRPRTIAELRSSRFGKLLSRPLLKPLIAQKGSGWLDSNDLAGLWSPDAECYLLTLGQWGSQSGSKRDRNYFQTSRPGVNLVLQLNFSNKHNLTYRQLIDTEDRAPFALEDHPVARAGYLTLAWARIDLDFDRGELLIEEIQTDWLRIVANLQQRLEKMTSQDGSNAAILSVKGVEIDQKSLSEYIQQVLLCHTALWDEAILSAAIWFARDELGFKNIFMHAFDSGNEIKNLVWSKPPRSLYSALPKKFCFERRDVSPRFLMDAPSKSIRRLKARNQLGFWRLTL
jgi:hypothetical protein